MNLRSGSGEESIQPVSSSHPRAAATVRPGSGGAETELGPAPERGEEDRGAALMLRWQAGDEGAFDQLVHLYSGHVFSLLTRFLGRAHPGREDLVQEVFLRVLGARDRYEATAQFSTWLYSICWRICINESERSSRRSTASLEGLGGADRDGHGLQLVDEAAPDPSNGLERGDLVLAVRSAIADLPETQRIALVLSRYHQLSHAEIASVVDSTEKAVKSLLHRARETLRATLQPLMEEETP
ncbi:ECF RNA polymerase sigma factor SigW [Planctomycetes bacterium Poly30]|uniref:ECF RNA polymerase sigma factor SigW n=1 Tax=Saltatorellus ferox TaxID=2528018 RepID=A0A518ELJ5_9BACT|nr:ECF RNA polymerase sigma factor SigW [Planctomycetes bacterium Poly30]